MSEGNTKSAMATAVGERFTAPRPKFNSPQNADYTIAKEKDNTPAKPLIQQVKESAGDKLAALQAKALENAKRAAAEAQARREGKTVSRPRKAGTKKTEPTTVVEAQVPFGPEDVCDDRTFIVRTRSGDYHTPEMKRLFWANGGESFMQAGLTYAQAFTMLRDEKQKNLRLNR